MQTTTESSSETDGAAALYALNNEIKSRSANLRGKPYEGGTRIEWAQSDCEMAPTITAGFMYGADAGDREGFFTRVLTARFNAVGDALRLLFGDNAEPLRPYSIQLEKAEYNGAPCAVKVLAQGDAIQVLLTVSATYWQELDSWIPLVMEAFNRCSAIADVTLLPVALR